MDIPSLSCIADAYQVFVVMILLPLVPLRLLSFITLILPALMVALTILLSYS